MYSKNILLTNDDGIDGEGLLELEKKLSEVFNMYHLVEDKQEYYNNCLYTENQPYALIKINANLQDLKVLIDAMKAIISFVIIVEQV